MWKAPSAFTEAEATAVVTHLPSPHKELFQPMTFDNGKEFAEHERVAAMLKAD
jgi:IS30 family transposase